MCRGADVESGSASDQVRHTLEESPQALRDAAL